MKQLIFVIFFLIAGFSQAAPPAIKDMSNSIKPVFLLSNPNGTGALYLDGKKIGNITNINPSVLKEADPTPTPKPDGPDFPPCTATSCNGGDPRTTPTPCPTSGCQGGVTFNSTRLILVPQETNKELGSSLDEQTQQLINSMQPPKE